MTNGKREKISGYTLLEVLVVLASTAILFTAGFAGFRQYERRQQLATAIKNLKTDLVLTQQLALSGQKPTDCTGTLQGYKIVLNTMDYTIYVSCNDDEPVKGPISYGPNIEYSGPASILFKVLAQGTDLTTDSELVLSQTTTFTNKALLITPAGEIRDQR